MSVFPLILIEELVVLRRVGLGKRGGQALSTYLHSFSGCPGRESEFLGALLTASREAHMERAGGGAESWAVLLSWGRPSPKDDYKL